MSKRDFSKELSVINFIKPQLGMPTGVEVIDDFLIWGGIPRASLCLFHSPLGSGSTTLWKTTMDHLVKMDKKVFWLQTFENSDLNFSILKDLIRNSFFEVLAISASDCNFSSEDLGLLKILLQEHKVTLIFICSSININLMNNFSLIIECDYDFLIIKKALMRPTPFYIPNHLVNKIWNHKHQQLIPLSVP